MISCLVCPVFLECYKTFKFENLLQERPIQEIVELVADGQGADFDTPMPLPVVVAERKSFDGEPMPGNKGMVVSNQSCKSCRSCG